MPTEADTCRKFVVPKLQAAGWDDEPHSIAEQRTIAPGRIIVRGNQAQRQKAKRVDYLLRYTRDFPIAVVEAKAEYKKASDGLQQAKNYAQMLDLKFAYASNGRETAEIDLQTETNQAFKIDLAPLDQLCHFTPNDSLFIRRQRADRVKCKETAFFIYLGPEAHEILDALLEKYAAVGELQFQLPDVLKVPLISKHGNANEIADKLDRLH